MIHPLPRLCQKSVGSNQEAASHGEATSWADVSDSRVKSRLRCAALAAKVLIAQHDQSMSVTKHF